MGGGLLARAAAPVMVVAGPVRPILAFGGAVYDFFDHGDRRARPIVADGAGKGMAAAVCLGRADDLLCGSNGGDGSFAFVFPRPPIEREQ